MVLLRRALVLAALMFWQGGFTFYAAVVVPIGQHLLHPPLSQGVITRQVTNYLNLAGAVALVPLLWDAAVSGERSVCRRRLRSLSWAGLAATLGLLAWLHVRLDTMLDAVSQPVDAAAFHAVHRVYLWTQTGQWGLALVYGALALIAWREEDRRRA
jgi:hypothetical protein